MANFHINFFAGFLPCFGPCFVNFYGSLREYSDLPDQYDDLNKGRGVGVAYRGRALVEIDTKFGDHADTKCQDILAQELIRVQVSCPVSSKFCILKLLSNWAKGCVLNLDVLLFMI